MEKVVRIELIYATISWFTTGLRGEGISSRICNHQYNEQAKIITGIAATAIAVTTMARP
jgi:hypothetical protein